MAPSIAVDGVLRSSQGQRRGDGSRALEMRPRPLDGGTFAARRGVRKGQEDSLRRGDTSLTRTSTLR